MRNSSRKRDAAYPPPAGSVEGPDNEGRRDGVVIGRLLRSQALAHPNGRQPDLSNFGPVTRLMRLCVARVDAAEMTSSSLEFEVRPFRTLPPKVHISVTRPETMGGGRAVADFLPTLNSRLSGPTPSLPASEHRSPESGHLAISVPSFVPSSRWEPTGAGRSPP
jgi:hypothetical protein